jgi:hypothetical protein
MSKKVSGWIKSKLFTCLIRGFSSASEPLFCFSHIMTSYCVSITEQTTAKSYLFVKYIYVIYVLAGIGRIEKDFIKRFTRK